MSWNVTVNAYGNKESATVEGETVMEAVEQALIELGYDENDEGTLEIKVTGEAS